MTRGSLMARSKFLDKTGLNVLTVKFRVVASVGVPLMSPNEDKDNPGGRVPLLMIQVEGVGVAVS
jgi:hypothetical protein